MFVATETCWACCGGGGGGGGSIAVATDGLRPSALGTALWPCCRLLPPATIAFHQSNKPSLKAGEKSHFETQKEMAWHNVCIEKSSSELSGEEDETQDACSEIDNAFLTVAL